MSAKVQLMNWNLIVFSIQVRQNLSFHSRTQSKTGPLYRRHAIPSDIPDQTASLKHSWTTYCTTTTRRIKPSKSTSIDTSQQKFLWPFLYATGLFYRQVAMLPGLLGWHAPCAQMHVHLFPAARSPSELPSTDVAYRYVLENHLWTHRRRRKYYHLRLIVVVATVVAVAVVVVAVVNIVVTNRVLIRYCCCYC